MRKVTYLHQQGNFSVELALVLVLACGFFYFVSDLGGQLIRQSRLDTVAYTLTNVIKERSKFFGGTQQFWSKELDSATEYELLDDLALMLLSEADSQIKTKSDYGISFELGTNFTKDSELLDSRAIGGVECHVGLNPFLYDFVPNGPGIDADHRVVYRVSICIETDSIFTLFFGNKRKLTLRSFAILPGRFFEVDE